MNSLTRTKDIISYRIIWKLIFAERVDSAKPLDKLKNYWPLHFTVNNDKVLPMGLHCMESEEPLKAVDSLEANPTEHWKSNTTV